MALALNNLLRVDMPLNKETILTFHNGKDVIHGPIFIRRGGLPNIYARSRVILKNWLVSISNGPNLSLFRPGAGALWAKLLNILVWTKARVLLNPSATDKMRYKVTIFSTKRLSLVSRVRIKLCILESSETRLLSTIPSIRRPRRSLISCYISWNN